MDFSSVKAALPDPVVVKGAAVKIGEPRLGTMLMMMVWVMMMVIMVIVMMMMMMVMMMMMI